MASCPPGRYGPIATGQLVADLTALLFLTLRQQNLLCTTLLIPHNIQAMSLVQPPAIAPGSPCSGPEEPQSPSSFKSIKSSSTCHSEETLSLQMKEEERRLSQQDPYFMNLVKKDKQFRLSPGFLNGKKINIKMRFRLIKWLQELIQEYQFKLETYFLTVTILDKYLEKTMETPQQLQLIGASCLYIASKLCESKLVAADVYVYSSGDTFDVSSLLAKEKSIMSTLAFNISFPHVTKFIRALGGLSNLQYQECQRILIILGQSVENYRYSRLQLAKMITLLVKSECRTTSMEELNIEVERLQNLLDF